MARTTRKMKVFDYIYNHEKNTRRYICNGQECESKHYSHFYFELLTYGEMLDIIGFEFKEDISNVLDKLNIKH